MLYLVELTFYRGRFRQETKCKTLGDDVEENKAWEWGGGAAAVPF